MFEAVLFDFDGTLVDFVEADSQSLQFLLDQTSSTIQFTDFLDSSVKEIMNFHELVEKQEIDPLQLYQFRLKNTFARYNIEWHDEYVDVYRDYFLARANPFPGVKPLLSALKQKVKIGLVTNTYNGDEKRARLKHAGLEPYFDTIVFAGEIGCFKPNPAIFRYALNLLQVPPERALFIGDSESDDILGANKAGLSTVFISQDSQKKSDFADYNVRNIDELQALLDRLII
jgi:2-haloalkanoic acid dehalogenase type II